MSYSLLQLVDQVSGELGLDQPSIVIGAGANQTKQLLALAQRLGKDLVRQFEWGRLTKNYVFQATASVSTTGTTVSASAVITAIPSTASIVAGYVVSGTGIPSLAQVASVDSTTQVTLDMPATASGTASTLTFSKQDYALPTGYDRMISDTNWDRTNHWRNLGTKNSQEWQTIQSGVISTGPRQRFRIYDNKLRIFPAPTTALNLSFEYVSGYWVIASGGTSATKATFTVDTDTSIFPDDLMMAGLKFYFLQAKKLDFGIEEEQFKNALSIAKATDEPISAMSLSPEPANELIGTYSIQDGNFPTS